MTKDRQESIASDAQRPEANVARPVHADESAPAAISATTAAAVAPSAPSAPSALPGEICGYPVVESLGASRQCYLAIGPGGRGVVLKRMDEQCLLRGLLHPSVRERLSRVRELAHAGLANLHGVGRDESGAWMIWEYVEGRTLADYAARDRTPREMAVVGRELAMTVESLHMQGIVHGALGAANVFVSPTSSVRITHVSPLLFNDPAGDAATVVEVLQECVRRRGGYKQRWPLAALLDEAAAEAWPLRVLATRLAGLIESRPERSPVRIAVQRDRERRSRRRSLVGAMLVVVIGLGGAYAIWRAIGEPGKAQMRQFVEPVVERFRN